MKQFNRADMELLKRKTVHVDILKADHPELPEDGFVLLREMDGVERDDYEINAVKTIYEKKKLNGKEVTETRREVEMKGLRARLVALCLVNDDGLRMYADDEIHQLQKAFPASVIVKLYEAAQELNGLNVTEEDAAKNSKDDHSGTSASASPLH